MKLTKRLAALLLTVVLALSLVACGGKKDAADDVVTYRDLYESEVTTLNYLYTSTTNEFRTSANFIDTLIAYDAYGNPYGSLATEWTTSPDGLTWTFKLREGVKWYTNEGEEYAELTADDFVAALHWVCTPENNSKTYDIVASVIKNAQKYFSGEVTDVNEIGVKAVDTYTLEYTLEAPCPYFLSMLSYVCFMPANRAFLEETGERFGTSADTLLYCGGYICEEWNPQENHLWVKNENYWNAENVFIDRIESKFNAEASKIAPEMYLQGTVDSATVTSELLDDWMQDDETKDLVRPSRLSTYTYWWLFNFDPKFDAEYEPENWLIAVNNENFRQSIAKGIDRVKAEAVYEPYNPEANLLRTITPAGFASIDGVDYTQMGDLAAITNTDPFDADAALEYKEKAMKELKAAGATFPVKIYMTYNPSTAYWGESCQILEQQLEGLLGTDYIDLIVEAGPSTDFLTETRRAGKYALMLCNWGPDYADPETYSDPWSLGYTYNWPEMTTQKDLLTGYTYTAEDMAKGVFDEEEFIGTAETVYIKMTQEAKDEKVDIAKRYELFANAEAFLINHAIVVPFHQQMADGYTVSKLSVFDAPYAAFGVSTYKYEGRHLLETPISMDEYYEQLDEWNAARG